MRDLTAWIFVYLLVHNHVFLKVFLKDAMWNVEVMPIPKHYSWSASTEQKATHKQVSFVHVPDLQHFILI